MYLARGVKELKYLEVCIVVSRRECYLKSLVEGDGKGNKRNCWIYHHNKFNSQKRIVRIHCHLELCLASWLLSDIGRQLRLCWVVRDGI